MNGWRKYQHIAKPMYGCYKNKINMLKAHRSQHLPADASVVTKPDTEEEDPTWTCQETHWARPFSEEGQQLVNKWVNKYHVRTREKQFAFLHFLKKSWMVLDVGCKDAAICNLLVARLLLTCKVLLTVKLFTFLIVLHATFQGLRSVR